MRFDTTTACASFHVDYGLCINDVQETIRLPNFHAPDDDDVTWAIELKQKPTPTWTPSGSYASKLCVSLSLDSRTKESVYAEVDVKIRQTSASEDIESTIKAVTDANLTTITEEDFILESNTCLSKYEKRSHFIGHVLFNNEIYNKLIVKATVRVTDLSLKVEPYYTRMRISAIASSPKTLSSCLASLLETGMFSDVTLEAQDQEVAVQRGVLAARSDFFEALLRRDDQVTHASPHIHIKDISFRVLMGMLR